MSERVAHAPRAPRRAGQRLRRGDRMVVMAQRLTAEPDTLHPLSLFSKGLDAAKSTISEDLARLRDVFARFSLGRIETVAGAAGGVRYRPSRDREQIVHLVETLCARLREPGRVLPGGFLYTTDLLSAPALVEEIGEAFATLFEDTRPDVVVTMEVKGIPLALMTARAFNIPVVTVRRGGQVTEGPSVSVHYVSGSSRTVQSMTLPLRAVSQGARALFIDDFLRGGGTARGMHNLMREFGAEMVGFGVLVETEQPVDKMLDRYLALITYHGVGAAGEGLVGPSRWVAALTTDAARVEGAAVQQ